MTIAENVIARLKPRPAESSTEDFQIGYNAGKDWAADAKLRRHPRAVVVLPADGHLRTRRQG